MKITIVQGAFLPVPPLKGGAIEKRFARLGPLWVSMGHSVTHISCAYPGLPAREVIEGVEHIRVPSFPSSGNMLIDKFYDLLYSLRVLKVLPKADAIISNTFFFPIFARNPQKHGRVYAYVGRFPKGQLWLYSHIARLLVPSRAVYKAALKQDPSHLRLLKVIPNALPHYPASGRDFTLSPFNTPASHYHILPEGLPNFPSTPHSFTSTPCLPLKLLFVGRLHPEKGCHVLLQALARLPADVQKQFSLCMVGPHEATAGGGGTAYFEELKALARKLITPVEFTGPLFDVGLLGQRYAAADLFIYPSLADKGETFGVAPLESLSYGVPALVSALECFEDFLRDGKNGFVFNHRVDDPSIPLAAALQNVLTQLPSWPQLSINARQMAGHFTLDRIAQLFINEFSL